MFAQLQECYLLQLKDALTTSPLLPCRGQGCVQQYGICAADVLHKTPGTDMYVPQRPHLLALHAAKQSDHASLPAT